MIHMLIVAHKREERELLYHQIKEQAALLTDEKWDISVHEDWTEEQAVGQNLLDIAYLDVTAENGIQRAELVREQCKNVFMVLMVSRQMSPMCYLKPSVMAASILMRPFSEEVVKANIREAISWLPVTEANKDEMFIIADRDGKIRIPYRKILYFEARAKKIYAALDTEEYGFYDSIDHLTEQLPNVFCRCHRSFVVNMRHLDKLQVSAGLCILKGNIQIPVSRSYKQNVREYFQ